MNPRSDCYLPFGAAAAAAGEKETRVRNWLDRHQVNYDAEGDRGFRKGFYEAIAGKKREPERTPHRRFSELDVIRTVKVARLSDWGFDAETASNYIEHVFADIRAYDAIMDGRDQKSNEDENPRLINALRSIELIICKGAEISVLLPQGDPRGDIIKEPSLYFFIVDKRTQKPRKPLNPFPPFLVGRRYGGADKDTRDLLEKFDTKLTINCGQIVKTVYERLEQFRKGDD